MKWTFHYGWKADGFDPQEITWDQEKLNKLVVVYYTLNTQCFLPNVTTWDPVQEEQSYLRKSVPTKSCTQNYQQTASVTDMLAKNAKNWDTLADKEKEGQTNLMYKLRHNFININTESHLILHPKFEHVVAIRTFLSFYLFQEQSMNGTLFRKR